jgi:hypothetical protein
MANIKRNNSIQNMLRWSVTPEQMRAMNDIRNNQGAVMVRDIQLPIEYESFIELKDKVEVFLSKISLKQKVIVLLRIHGVEIKAIAQLMNSNRTYIGNDIRAMKDIWDCLI